MTSATSRCPTALRSGRSAVANPPATPAQNGPVVTLPLPPRYAPDALPAYRHVPGRTPHPTRDERGHAYGRPPEPTPPDLNRTPPGACPSLLYGIDLFNQRYWWECHEVLEALWRSAGPGSAASHVLQAVIQCAAAHLKFAHDDHAVSARRLFEQAEHHIARAEGMTLGLDLVGLLAETGAFVTGDSPQPARLFWQAPTNGRR